MESGVKPVRWVIVHRESLLMIATLALVFAAVVSVSALVMDAY